MQARLSPETGLNNTRIDGALDQSPLDNAGSRVTSWRANRSPGTARPASAKRSAAQKLIWKTTAALLQD
jgi:hypothetical protein